jgi:hypothetical protein
LSVNFGRNRFIESTPKSIDICDESSSSLLMADTGHDDVAVVACDAGVDMSDDDATTVHECDDEGDEELLPLEVDTTQTAVATCHVQIEFEKNFFGDIYFFN